MKLPGLSYYMHDGPTAFSIEVAGILAADAANKLEQDWRSASAAICGKELVVDLSFVTEIDPRGRRLLLRWFRNGATVVANTPESRALAESIIGQPVPAVARIANTSSPYRSGSFFQDLVPIIGLLALLIPASASAQRVAPVSAQRVPTRS